MPPPFFSVGGDTDGICDQLDIDIQNTEHNKVSAVGESFQSTVNSFSSVNTVSPVIDATTVDSKHQTPPTAPRNVRLSSLSRIGNTSRFRYTINWNHPSSSGSSDLDRYEAEINFGGRWDRIAGVTGTGRGITTATIGGYGIPHRFRIRAYNEGGEVSPWSSEVMFTTWNSPTSPSLTATAGGSDNIVLTWTVPDPRGRPITGYKIQVSENGTSGWTDLIETTDPTLTTHTHESLPPGTTRYYSIFAINSIGLSDRSVVVSSTTLQ
ncbi:MAG: fibronectin type III domain-containing protein [Bacteroidetes bacterium]|nr:fibronectin type III domain-containing protein [Bacteroidota bacterium]